LRGSLADQEKQLRAIKSKLEATEVAQAHTRFGAGENDAAESAGGTALKAAKMGRWRMAEIRRGSRCSSLIGVKLKHLSIF
jgi:hypothetical protein